MRLIVSSMPRPDAWGWGSRHAETIPEMTFAARHLRGSLRLVAGRGTERGGSGCVANRESQFGHSSQLGGRLDVASIAWIMELENKTGNPAPVTNPGRELVRASSCESRERRAGYFEGCMRQPKGKVSLRPENPG